ncbi:pentatricopeptide repeat-containing protein At4g18975, chloroplastic isoform X4 [Amborella trichopoda]|uniref:pentatricopeptide repeat-containing protein At4g18975, chloroplastic isoform X4 n=1 Tax=Amborella trichopoda TaxID=13333 RepID=UPI0009C134D7|nr:pentatricopeptide repeat-containing protein At4g18975, chloroplastic isoform X4 [Amborella trichopoda]|eukprot:XP_020527289.1 pentatricopeptide repeat-containing protein At4g18975, chloroplastic isoform X4 [Amborella trichopoda]
MYDFFRLPGKTFLRGHHIWQLNAHNADSKFFSRSLLAKVLHLKASKEAVYGALDAWVAWEHKFPIVSLKRTLAILEKEQQWHQIIQVIKWMLSKGQGTTMNTYEQLICALDKDDRAEEAHMFWQKRIGHDLHSVPWKSCKLMISIYYRNNMLERLVKLFKGLETFDREPPEKSIVLKVANSYELLGRCDEKETVLEKYNYLFNKSSGRRSKKSKVSKKDKECGEKREKHKGMKNCLGLCKWERTTCTDPVKAATRIGRINKIT